MDLICDGSFVMTVTPTIPEAPHPVSAHERIDLIDVVRGFALFGVLLANLVWITTDVVLTDARLSQLPTAPLDRIVEPLVAFFVDHKFYTLFSFLFGLGFAIQLSRAEERRHNVVAVYARRVSILAVIGLLHIALVWYGDILLVYAIGGFGLLAVRHWNARLLIILAFTLALFARAAVGVFPLIAGASGTAQVDGEVEEDADKERKLAIFDGTSYRAIARENASFYYRDIVAGSVGLFLLPQVFARFIFGLYVGRRNWARRTTELRPILRRLLPRTIAVGVVGNGTALVIDHLQHAKVLGPDLYLGARGRPRRGGRNSCPRARVLERARAVVSSQCNVASTSRIPRAGRPNGSDQLSDTFRVVFRAVYWCRPRSVRRGRSSFVRGSRRRHLRRADDVQRLVARAVSLRSGGVGVANVDLSSEAADACTRADSDRVAACLTFSKLGSDQHPCIRKVVNRRSPILRPRLSAVSDSSSAVEGPAQRAGVAGDHLPPIATLSPDVHDVEVAASVLTIAARLLRQEKTECREIIGQLASGVVALFQRLDFVSF